MAKKKDKKAAAKRRAKSKQQKQKKRKLKLVRQQRQEEYSDYPLAPTPAMSDIEVPEGFRTVSMIEAIMEFGKALIVDDMKDDPEELNKVFGIANSIWNYEAALNGGFEGEQELQEIRNDILGKMENLLEIDPVEGEEVLQNMVERKQYLFPSDIQPEYPMTMYIRKEVSQLITPFNYGGLRFSEEPIPPDERDQAVIDKIREMDRYVVETDDYDEELENLFFPMAEELQERYEHWLNEKGMSVWSQTFAANLDIFLNFIYYYTHDDLVMLKLVPPEYFAQFFFDYLLRKVITEPQEYVVYPPAVKFFYKYLHEKGYIHQEMSKIIADVIDQIEPEFIEVLRERFS